MIKKAWIFVCEHGYVFMLVGIALIVAAAIMLVQSRQAGAPFGPLVWPTAIVGVVIYVLGRAGVAGRNRWSKRKEALQDTRSDSQGPKDEGA
jgi:hypothetical protein